MCRLPRLICAALLLCALGSAQAGIIFTPRLSEYARLAPGPYDEFAITYARIEDSFDRHGRRTPVGAPFVAPGQAIDAALLTYKALWVGQPFRDSGLTWLEDRELFCRAIFTAGWQQASRAVAERGRKFGDVSGGAGPGDVFALCGVYSEDLRWRSWKFNGLFSATLKLPVGRWDRDALLNVGTNYWSTIPQLGLHAQWRGRLFVDATLAWQLNGDNDDPAYGGMTPTRPADVRNAEANFAWKFSERWFADIGVSYRETVGSNRYDGVDIRNREPLEATEACNTLSLDPALCAATGLFILQSQPGAYRDEGVRATLLTAGLSYVYRNSTVLSLRALLPVEGRGAQLDISFDLYLAAPDPQNPGRYAAVGPPLLQTTSTLNGVQEAASVSASPAIELRLVHLFWAP